MAPKRWRGKLSAIEYFGGVPMAVKETQPYFDGFEPGCRPATPRKPYIPWGWHKLFFAFLPSSKAATAAVDISLKLGRQHRLPGKPVRTRNFHISLFPYTLSDVLYDQLLEEASVLVQAIRGKPFEMTLDKAMSFANCLVLGSTREPGEIYTLHRQFADRFKAFGNAGDLTPHMTLLYTDKRIEEQRIEPIHWTIEEFVLIDSIQGQGCHEIVGRWPLR
jgi:2'-5' RNA ligase